jgi:hypothetical protein
MKIRVMHTVKITSEQARQVRDHFRFKTLGEGYRLLRSNAECAGEEMIEEILADAAESAKYDTRTEKQKDAWDLWSAGKGPMPRP